MSQTHGDGKAFLLFKYEQCVQNDKLQTFFSGITVSVQTSVQTFSLLLLYIIDVANIRAADGMSPSESMAHPVPASLYTCLSFLHSLLLQSGQSLICAEHSSIHHRGFWETFPCPISISETLSGDYYHGVPSHPEYSMGTSSGQLQETSQCGE